METMARRRSHQVESLKLTEDPYDYVVGDAGDAAFWDEFWLREELTDETGNQVTVVIRNEDTGEERVIGGLRLRLRSMRKIREV